MTWPSPEMTATLVTIIGKGFIMFADSLPPPSSNCGYWTRFLYDFCQRIASNSAKVGTAKGDTIRDTGAPPEKKLTDSISTTATTAEQPTPLAMSRVK
jgi:hypothetical protein